MLAKEGTLLLRSNQNDLAAEKLKQAIELYPGLPESHHNLALALAKQGRIAEAIDEMRLAVDLKPDSEASWISLAGFHQSAGNIGEAVDTYSQFLARFPASAMTPKVKALLSALKEEQSREAANASAASLLGGDSLGANEESRSGNDDYLSLMQEMSGLKRWPANRIPVPVFIWDGSSVPGYRESLRSILLKSFEDWSEASDRQIRFKFVDNPKESLLQVFWTDRPEDLHNSAEAGDARIFMDQQYICRGEVWFLTRTLSSGQTMTDNYFRLVSLHEIGHALGLSGHTRNPKDVMFYSVTYNESWRELSGRDRRSIKRLYGSDL